MGKLQYLILHNAATPPNREVTKDDLVEWHIKGRGWKRLGYSKLFQRNGNVIDLYDVDNDQWIDSGEITNGAKGFNSTSVHWCFAGGLNKANRVITGNYDKVLTGAQFISLRTELNDFLRYHPDIKIIGHNQVANKACPGFEVYDLLNILRVPNKFIHKGKI